MPMTGSPPQPKRKRVVTSCSECHRRKQKCDRKYPCNHCLARNVVDKCAFNGSPTDSRAIEYGDRVSGSQRGQELPTPASEITHQEHLDSPADLGYSNISGSNAFMGLEKVLEDEEFQGIRRIRNPVPRPHPVNAEAQRLLSNLPPRSVVEELVRLFFAQVNWHYFIIEKFYFDDMFARWQSTKVDPVGYLTHEELSRELQYFPAVVFQVIALALQFLPPDAPTAVQSLPDTLPSPLTYSNWGDELLSLLGRPGFTLTGVLADLLRSSFLKNCSQGIQAWHAVGYSVRQAQELGLHRHREIHQSHRSSIDKTLSLFWYDEYKKRIWINLFVWDSLMSVILGRPRMINMDDCDAKLPMDCNIPKDPSTAVPMTIRRDENQTITTVSASLFRYALSEKVHKMRSLKLDRPQPEDYSHIQLLHEEVISLLDGLPPPIRPKNPDVSWDAQYLYLPQQREEILVMTNLVLMALHRQHLVSHRESRKAAVQAALATLDSQQRCFEQIDKHHYPLFGLAFYTVDACFLLFITATLYPPGSHETKLYIDHTLRQAIQRLSILDAYNPIAKAGLAVLRRCYKNIPESRQPSGDPFGTVPGIYRPSHPKIHDTMTGSCNPNVGEATDLPSEPYGLSEIHGSETTSSDIPPDFGDFDQTYWLDQIDQICQMPQPPLEDPNSDAIWEFLDLDQGDLR